MGLLEKRAIKAFQEGTYKTLVKEINTIAGYELEFEVEWNSLAIEGDSHLYEECFPKVYFAPIITAFKEITIDDMGKEALQETLKKIVIKNEESLSYANSGKVYRYNDGELHIDHLPTTNIDQIADRSEVLGDLLMKQM